MAWAFWRSERSGLGALGLARTRGKRRAANAAYDLRLGSLPPGAVRDAGREAMRDPPPEEEWTDLDEELDESFPASDPPANY